MSTFLHFFIVLFCHGHSHRLHNYISCLYSLHSSDATCGICGNMNGDISDDFMTAEGQDVTGNRNRYTLIGNSWQVANAQDDAK